MTTKTLRTLDVASAITGIVLAEGISFSRIHEASEALLGHPVWTHEFADEDIRSRITAAGLALFPEMPTREAARTDFVKAAQQALAAYGETIDVPIVKSERSESPIDSLARVMSP